MPILIRTTNEVTVLAFEGRLDTLTSPDAEQQLTRCIEEGEKRFLVNFEKLDYINSAGLCVLLVAAKKLEGVDGELRFCNLNEIVREVFDISGFTTIFRVFGSEAEALDGF
jgi:anti-sigma B factor antagonist